MVTIAAPVLRRRRDSQLLPGGLLPPLKLIESQTLSVAAASVTFSSIPSTLGTHLVVLVYAANSTAANVVVSARLNGDSGANYNDEILHGANVTATAAAATGATSVNTIGTIPGTNYTNGFGGGAILIPHAFNTTKHKSVLSFGGGVEDRVQISVGRWANTGAITSIQLLTASGNFVADSRFDLCVVDDAYLIDSSILSGDGIFSFTNIPQYYADLVVIGDLRSDLTGSASDPAKIEVNADTTTTNYHRQFLNGVNATAPTAASANDNLVFTCADADDTAGSFAGCLLSILGYAEGTNDPAYISISGHHDAADPRGQNAIASSRRNNTEAVNRVDIKPSGGTNFVTNSGLWLYGRPRPKAARVGYVKLGAAQSSIEFPNIPSGHRAFTVTIYGNTSQAAVNDTINVSFNGDTTAGNYDTQLLHNNTTTTVAAARSASNRAWITMTGDSEGDNEFGVGSLTVVNYSSTVGHKHGVAISGRTENEIRVMSCRWENTSAITRMTLTPAGGGNFLSGTIAILSVEK